MEFACPSNVQQTLRLSAHSSVQPLHSESAAIQSKISNEFPPASGTLISFTSNSFSLRGQTQCLTPPLQRFYEVCNNAIKALKRLTFSFKSFSVFRSRITRTFHSPLHLIRNRFSAVYLLYVARFPAVYLLYVYFFFQDLKRCVHSTFLKTPSEYQQKQQKKSVFL